MDALKLDWLVYLGRTECEAWLDVMAENNLPIVKIKTPRKIDPTSAELYQDEVTLEYTVTDFNAAIDYMDSQED